MFRLGDGTLLASVAIHSEAKIGPFPFGVTPQNETGVARQK